MLLIMRVPRGRVARKHDTPAKDTAFKEGWQESASFKSLVTTDLALGR
jgi:hypothetical protein